MSLLESLSYLMVVDREAPASEGLRRGERLEMTIGSMMKALPFGIRSGGYVDSERIKSSYFKSGTTVYIRQVIDQFVHRPSVFGGLNLPDFFIVDGDFVLPRPKTWAESYETSALEKGKVLNTILISLIVYLDENRRNGLENATIPFFIFARKSTIANGHLALLKERPIRFFSEYLYFEDADTDWKAYFNEIIDSYSAKRIRDQFDFHISEISDFYTSFNLAGVSEKLEDAFECKKKRLKEFMAKDDRVEFVLEQPSAVRNNFSNENYCENGTIMPYGTQICQVRDPRMFTFLGGVYNASNRHDVEDRFFLTFKTMWQLSKERKLMDAVQLDFSKTIVNASTAHTLLLLINQLTERYGQEFKSLYQKNLDDVLYIYVPQLYNDPDLRRSFSLLEKYFSIERQPEYRAISNIKIMQQAG